jgi:hypothetical protein
VGAKQKSMKKKRLRKKSQKTVHFFEANDKIDAVFPDDISKRQKDGRKNIRRIKTDKEEIEWLSKQ